MIKQNPTINDVINELMFIAIAKPEKFNVSVMYIGYVDAIEVRVLTADYCAKNLDKCPAKLYSESKVFEKTVYLDSLTAFKDVMSMYNELISLLENKHEVAA